MVRVLDGPRQHVYQRPIAERLLGPVTGLNILAPRPLAIRVLSSIDDLVGWLPAEHKRRTGVVLDGDALRQAIQESRDAIRPATARGSIG